MLERAGATVVHGPVMVTRPVTGGEELRAATALLIAQPPDILIANTGIGMRGWLNAAEAWGCAGELHAALARARIVARGPKAAGALAGADLEVWRREESERLDALIAGLAADGQLAGGRRVAMQLYGSASEWAVEALRAAGADVVSVPVYRWSVADDTQPARRLIEMTVDGRIDAVTFTSPPAVRFCFALADEHGHADAFRRRLNDSCNAVCVGPVTAAAARNAGVFAPVAPERGRLGLLVREVVNVLGQQRTVLDVAGHTAVLRGKLLTVDGVDVELPHLERQVFAALAQSPGAVVPRSRLLRDVWGAGDESSRALEATVARLRRRIGPLAPSLVVHNRRGYRLDATLVPNGSYDESIARGA